MQVNICNRYIADALVWWVLIAFEVLVITNTRTHMPENDRDCINWVIILFCIF